MPSSIFGKRLVLIANASVQAYSVNVNVNARPAELARYASKPTPTMTWKRIRKDSGEISIADLQAFPSWHFCLDEEHVEGQTECTMRPFKPRDVKLSPDDNCMAAVQFTFPSGAQHIGWIELGAVDDDWADPWNLSPEIFLDTSTPVATRDLIEFDLITKCEASIRLSFCLPLTRTLDDETATLLSANVSRALGFDPSETFPVSLTPLQPIRNWPESFLLERFYRPPEDDQPYRRYGELDAPNCPACGKQLRTKLAKQCFECGNNWH